MATRFFRVILFQTVEGLPEPMMRLTTAHLRRAEAEHEASEVLHLFPRYDRHAVMMEGTAAYIQTVERMKALEKARLAVEAQNDWQVV